MSEDRKRTIDALTAQLAENDLLWTCASCGADYTKAEMDRAMYKGKNSEVRYYTCTTCGATGNFVDGPDA